MINKKLINNILADEPSFRQKQVYQAIYKNLIASWDEAQNLPKELREKLNRECPLEIKAVWQNSKNKNTIKAAIGLEDGVVEAVLMRHKDRNTVCVSSSIGCPLACDFCATGKAGFTRNLSAGEIVDQVLIFGRLLKKENKRVDNIVFMGMGEPFLNYEEVMKAIGIMNDKEGLNIGARKISLSTVGIIEGIRRLAGEKMQVNLAVSFHFSDDKLRSEYMPINNKYPIAKLLQTINYYLAKTKRKVMIEYIMLAGINDSQKDAEKLADLLKKNLNKPYCVNLVAYNHTPGYFSSDRKKIGRFKEVLVKEKIEVTERYGFGRDIKAACGQLAGQ